MKQIKDGGPGELPPVEVMCPCDEFENAVRKFGVVNACEWFGADREFAAETVKLLSAREGKS